METSLNIEVELKSKKLELEYLRVQALRDQAYEKWKALADQTDKAFLNWKNFVISQN